MVDVACAVWPQASFRPSLGPLCHTYWPRCSPWNGERCSRLFLSLQVFSIVVFGSIVNEGYLNNPEEEEEFCIYNRNPNACSYGVTVGVLAFLTCLLYLALDVYFPQISSVKDRKKAVLSDIGVSGEPALGVSLNSMSRALSSTFP